MSLARRASIPHAAMLLILAVGALLYAFVGYHGALRDFDAATAAPVVDYVVSGKKEAKVGKGRTRRSAYLLQLTQASPQPVAPQSTELAVTRRIYGRGHVNDRWTARIVAGKPLFDPRLTGIESENRLLLVVLGGLLGIAGAIVLRQALRNRS